MCTLTDESEQGEGGEEGDPEGAGEGQEGESTGEEGEAAEQQAEPHYDLGMIQELTVTGDGDAELPAADGSFTARDYSFEVDVSAGRGTYNFMNEGPEQFHHVALFAFPEGVDEAAAREAFDAFAQAEGSGEPPPPGTPEPEETAFSSVYSPGLGGTFEAEFESGRTYGAVCFIQDKQGGHRTPSATTWWSSSPSTERRNSIGAAPTT